MTRLIKEIKECMFDLNEINKEEVCAHFIFPPEFIGFKGHFPNNPILPGVCSIQATMVIIRVWKKKDVSLKEIVLAKFFKSVSCQDELIFKCHEDIKNSNESLLKATITSMGEKIAHLQLKVNYKNLG